MTEGQQFFLILCLLYLSECVLWVKPRAWVFLDGWWGRWRVSEPSDRAGRGRFVLAQCLPPLGWGFACGEEPVRHTGVSAVRARLDEFTGATARLHALAAYVALPWFFVLVPALYWRLGAGLPFWVVLGAGWGVLVACGVLFARAHRRLFPEGKGEQRWTHTLLVSLVPQHAMRAPGLLARAWLAECHPLAVAAAVLAGDEFRRLAGRVWREFAFPRPDRAGPTTAEREAVEAILREAGLDPASLLAPPPAAGGAVAYCPRCHVLFENPGAVCSDCGGLAVTRF